MIETIAVSSIVTRMFRKTKQVLVSVCQISARIFMSGRGNGTSRNESKIQVYR